MFARLAQAETLYNGVAAGDPTDTSVVLWTRTADSNTNQGTVSNLTAQVSPNSSFGSQLYTYGGVTDPNRDYTLKLQVTGLSSVTRYYYRFQASDGKLSPVGTFKTAPKKTDRVAVRFGFSGDADGQWRPYSSTKDFNQLNLDFFVFIGDTIYETKSSLSPATADPFTNPTQALSDYRRKYLEQLEPVTPGGFTGLQTFFASQGNYTLLDNHELGNKQFINGGAPPGTPAGQGVDASDPANDVNTTGTFINQTNGFKLLEQAYSDYEPILERNVLAPDDPRTNGTRQLFYTQQWGANCLFVNVDDRSYRDIRLKTASGADDTGPRADNPNRTMLGKTELKWLEKTLFVAQQEDVRWKIVAVSSPIDEVGGDGGKSWVGGYRAERNKLLKFIADYHINNVVFLSTDDHQNRINELTYLANPADPNSRTRVPYTFTIVAGPIGAGGPDAITDHSFNNILSLTNSLVASEQAQGIDPIGLDPTYPGLQNVYRENDPNADALRQPVDFYSPDTFNYVTLDISADGNSLSVNTYGINSYQPNTFPEPAQAGNVRHILGFQINTPAK
ncbi:MAG: alkaline phosphatase D family protein [Chroococcidiopsidaceae cyanobacterium CP_BM_RX_35]|nr:alkaline phosphatase D family protein [Chroococcidiopsidaceae cyanobacterium CP_BM_RX_35]